MSALGGKPIRVLIVDDEGPTRRALETALSREGFDVTSAVDGEEGLQLLSAAKFEVLLLDHHMPGRTGVDILREVRGGGSPPKVVMITGRPEVNNAVEAMKLGAYDYISKPIDLLALTKVIRNAGERQLLERENAILRTLVSQQPSVGPMVNESPEIKEVLRLVERIASSSAPVLITGETGTGKGLIANTIHQSSDRAEEPFMQVNCGALQEQLFESELFGHRKGAFTGAVSSKQGLFEVADGGTLFLDEVAELSPAMQAKLLQVLDSGELRRVGETAIRKVDARILAATNKDLRAEVQEGRFREDLFFRLNVVRLVIPALRKRRQDVAGLVKLYLQRFQRPGRPQKTISDAALRLLLDYRWPGNVRELQNTIETIMLLAPGDVIQPSDLPLNFQPVEIVEHLEEREPLALSEVERLHILRTLSYTSGAKARAARILGIDVKTLGRKLKAYKAMGLRSDSR